MVSGQISVTLLQLFLNYMWFVVITKMDRATRRNIDAITLQFLSGILALKVFRVLNVIMNDLIDSYCNILLSYNNMNYVYVAI